MDMKELVGNVLRLNIKDSMEERGGISLSHGKHNVLKVKQDKSTIPHGSIYIRPQRDSRRGKVIEIHIKRKSRVITK